MLLGIPGDNTYANYQEAQRAFWRGTVLPLVSRMAKAFSAWLACQVKSQATATTLTSENPASQWPISS
jgi:phage portal protein BeeE